PTLRISITDLLTNESCSCTPQRPASRLLREGLDEDRDPLSPADACRRDPVAPPAPTKLEEQREDEPRPRGAERMAQRDRAAVDVHLVAVELQRLLAREVLRGERLVDLEQVDVPEREPRLLDHATDRRNGPDSHDARLNAHDVPGDDPSECAAS